MSSLPMEWLNLADAWRAGKGVSDALDAIDWDRPAMIWALDESGERVGQMVHPLSMVFELSDSGLALRAIEHVMSKNLGDDYTTVTTPSLSLGEKAPRVLLPPMSNLWEWGVLDSALKANDWAAASVLLPHVARNSHDHRFGHLATSMLCERLAGIQDPQSFLGLWQVLSSPSTTLMERRFLAGMMLTHLGKVGSTSAVEAFISSERAGFVDFSVMVHLASRGHSDTAMRVAQFAESQNDVVGHPQLVEMWLKTLSAMMGGPLSTQAADHVAWLVSSREELARALTTPTAFPGAECNSWPVLAQAVLQASPYRFDGVLAQSAGPSQAVLVEWSRHTLPSNPKLAPWLDRYRQSVSPSIQQQALEAIIQDEQAQVSPSGPLNVDERADKVVRHLAVWAAGLGLDVQEVKNNHVPPAFQVTDKGPSPAWRRALARHEASGLEHSLPLTQPAPKLRM